ncbi:MAG: HAMP domain-containing histidine kinase [Hyphomicrobiales bacterium]|nr:HAMP domain-containing histidine kinase [Hyphomicrobiales bacterium]
MARRAPLNSALPFGGNLIGAILRQQNIGIAVFDETGAILLADKLPAASRLKAGGALDDDPLFTGIFAEILALQGKSRVMEFSGVSLPGDAGNKYDIRIRWQATIGLFIVLFHSANERVAFETKIAQDARERRLLLETIAQQQRQIEAQNALMASFSRHVPAAAAMLDADLRYVLASDRWIEQTGAPLTGRPFREGLPGPAKRWEAALRRKDGAIKSGVEKLVDAKGRTRWQRWEQHRLDDKDDSGARTLVFAQDITKAVEQTERLRQQARQLTVLNEDMRGFALAVAHDLRAPVRQIQAFARFLAEPGQAPGDLVENGARIGLCADRLAAMLDSLLRFARIEAAPAESTTFPLLRAIKAARDTLAEPLRARAMGVTVVAKGMAQARVSGDEGLLTLLFQNLFDNALKYNNAAAPRLSVTLRRKAALVEVEIEDNGPGIPPQIIGKAFDLFQRLNAPKGVTGAGVGLALCRKIAEAHQGAIRLSTPREGGLRATLTLPLA